MHCYCLELSSVDQFSDRLCDDFVRNNLRAFGFMVTAVGVAVGANSLILSLMDYMSTHFEVSLGPKSRPEWKAGQASPH